MQWTACMIGYESDSCGEKEDAGKAKSSIEKGIEFAEKSRKQKWKT